MALHHASAADAAMGYPDAALALAGELRGAGCEIASVDADLSETGAAARVMSESLRALGGIDILVLCASVQIRQPFEAVTRESIERHTRINFDASIELLQLALGAMTGQRFGRIISIGSVLQARPHRDLAVYAALKSAQHNLILGIARQHAAAGITANTIAPGLIETPRNASRRRDAGEWASIQKASNPMGRAGTPEEVAHVAALLAAPAGAFITGAEIPVDGGGRL